MTRLTTAQAIVLGIMPQKKSKYHSNKVCIDGIKFDSRKEANKYCELKLLQKAGEVIELHLQPEFILQDGYIRNGKKIRPIVYRADFQVKYKDGREVVIDTKGYRTKEYLIKKKLLLARYPEIEFIEE